MNEQKVLNSSSEKQSTESNDGLDEFLGRVQQQDREAQLAAASLYTAWQTDLMKYFQRGLRNEN